MFFGGSSSLVLIVLGFSVLTQAFAQSIAPIYTKAIYSLPLSLDPIKMNDTASLAVGNLIYDGLLKFSPSLKIEGALAESWTTSKDGKTLTFNLKKNIFFHNGEKITAYDAVASLKRALLPESTVRKFYDSIKAVRAVDARTFEIELNYPFPPFLSVLAGATAKILPKAKLSDPKYFDAPIGSGAFKFVSLDKSKKEVTLDAFPQYYSGKTKIERMILKETTEEQALNLARKGQMHDLASWPLTEANSIFTKGQRISSPVASTWIIGINTLKAPFNILNVRQSFKMNFPVAEYRERFYPDSIKANGYIPNGLTGSQVKANLVANARPSKEKIVIAIPVELARATEMKTMIENFMKNHGWNVEVALMKWDLLMEGYAKKSHQAFLVAMNMDYPDADFLLKNFESDNSDNFSGLKNKNLDKLIKKSRATQDRKLREVYYREALKLLEVSAVTVNLFHPRANYWISKCVEDFKPNILSDVYIDYSKVSLSATCLAQKVANQ
ncbi:MAG: hypothetical protein A4S09_14980 [Proteobacteria bacterium SG_bin7]|nr:MAG: hypothetical protein A4S09_14980 [Proteobacteria bacterium SG_bin7]